MLRCAGLIETSGAHRLSGRYTCPLIFRERGRQRLLPSPDIADHYPRRNSSGTHNLRAILISTVPKPDTYLYQKRTDSYISDNYCIVNHLHFFRHAIGSSFSGNVCNSWFVSGIDRTCNSKLSGNQSSSCQSGEEFADGMKQM